MFVPKFYSLPSALLPVLATVAASITPLISSIDPVFAQAAIPVCQPPNPGEYLLLVVSPTTSNQQQLRSALPSDLKTVTCQYLNETVTRIGGFNKIDDANRWAKYVNNIVGLSAIITTRPTSPTVAPATITPPITTSTRVVPATVAPTITTSATVPNQKVSYNPRVLGDGFAVLVDYFNRPELANSVQMAVGGNVGLVSYGQRPYLLAVYTTNQTEAYNTLQKLTEKGFFALLADGRKVMLLRSVVSSK
ncbi:hypothetical protein A0J48_011720 [Sphaerospermopsis aphanizomenoides BCCUSP55]|uniref:hypothetical protein n=1 Tax=Sphaerospermopsis aphanizomenoides TaxID=459663 RepID=UPI0019083CBA|nr:hypothetical protein [Sphaerospermopsis aphanizomenoides]MBK1988198.1 hypothetical protein [Sphaerospermopsis aphanizomenoides BCCUSP55]